MDLLEDAELGLGRGSRVGHGREQICYCYAHMHMAEETLVLQPRDGLFEGPSTFFFFLSFYLFIYFDFHRLIINFIFFYCCAGWGYTVACIYKSPYNMSNISYLNSSPLPSTLKAQLWNEVRNLVLNSRHSITSCVTLGEFLCCLLSYCLGMLKTLYRVVNEQELQVTSKCSGNKSYHRHL
jgi:hypothetical protein